MYEKVCGTISTYYLTTLILNLQSCCSYVRNQLREPIKSLFLEQKAQNNAVNRELRSSLANQHVIAVLQISWAETVDQDSSNYPLSFESKNLLNFLEDFTLHVPTLVHPQLFVGRIRLRPPLNFTYLFFHHFHNVTR